MMYTIEELKQFSPTELKKMLSLTKKIKKIVEKKKYRDLDVSERMSDICFSLIVSINTEFNN